MLELLPELKPQPSQLDDRPRILVVDDEPDQLDVLALRLRQQGFDVVTAGSGQQARQNCQQQRPDLVLMDIQLPDASGLEVCQQLYDDPSMQDVPILLVSGVDRADIVRAARAAGSRFYIRKPYDPNALLALIRTALEAR